VPDWARAEVMLEGDVRLDGAYGAVRVPVASLGVGSSGESSAAIHFFASSEDRLWTGRYLDIVDVAPGPAGLSAPERLWAWEPAGGALEVWPVTSTVPSGEERTVRVGAVRGRSEGFIEPPRGVLFGYPFNSQSGEAPPRGPGEAYAITIPERLAPFAPPAYLPALHGRRN
jgi:hypothetical protein